MPVSGWSTRGRHLDERRHRRGVPGREDVVVDVRSAISDHDDDDQQRHEPRGRPGPGAPAGRRHAPAAAARPGRGRAGVAERWGSPRPPRRRSRQVRTYSRSVSDDPATDPGRDGRAEHPAAARHHGRAPRRRRAGPARPRRPRSRASRPPRWARWPAWAARRPPTSTARSADDAPAVRRRAADAALAVRGRGSRSRCPPPSPARSATPTRWSWSARPGSWPSAGTGRPCRRWRAWRRAHDDVRCREAAVAALGRDRRPARAAAGHRRARTTSRRCGAGPPSRWPASTTRGSSRPCAGAAEDRDWQVRQAADELLDEPPERRRASAGV